MSFEKKIKDLEHITQQLAGGKLSLEDSLKSFEKGIKLSQECSQELNKSEEKVKQLMSISADGHIETKDFEDK